METRESMHTGDVPTEKTLPSYLNWCSVLAALPFPKNPFSISSAPTEAALKGSHLGQESLMCWKKIQRVPTSRDKAESAQHFRREDCPSNLYQSKDDDQGCVLTSTAALLIKGVLVLL